jgi:hypothetical protein
MRFAKGEDSIIESPTAPDLAIQTIGVIPAGFFESRLLGHSSRGEFAAWLDQ